MKETVFLHVSIALLATVVLHACGDAYYIWNPGGWLIYSLLYLCYGACAWTEIKNDKRRRYL